MHLTRRSLVLAGATLPLLSRVALAREPGQLVFGLSSYPPNLEPWKQTGTASGTVKLLIFRGLTSFNAAGKVQGELAESFAPDGATGWVFKLRDAVFHDGSPVTVEDVKWTIEQMGAPRSTAYMRTQFQGVQAIETPDPKTIRIVMKEPTVTLPTWFANFNAPIIKKGTLEDPIGAGPFVLAGQERGVSVTLKAFDKYYKPGLPKLKGIRMVAYADESLRVAALQAGDVDIIEYVPWQSMTTIERDPALKLDTTNGPFMGLLFNGARGPFKDARVRQAVAFAIRREDIVKAAFFGRGAVLQGIPIDPQSEFFDAGLAKHWAYDPDKAKALLKEAGVGGGLMCSLLSTAQYGMHKATAEVVQQHLAEVNIAVDLKLPDWPTRVALGNRGQYEFTVTGTTAESPDPDGLTPIIDSTLSPSSSRSYGIKATEIHDLLAAGRAEFDPKKRKAIYDKMQEQEFAEVTLTGLAWRSQGYAMRKQVTGFKNLPGSLTFNSGQTLETTSIASA